MENVLPGWGVPPPVALLSLLALPLNCLSGNGNMGDLAWKLEGIFIGAIPAQQHSAAETWTPEEMAQLLL